MFKDLLLEIGTEEIPARFIPAAITGIRETAERLFKESRIRYKEMIAYGTPRRLTLIVREVDEIQEDIIWHIMHREDEGLQSRAWRADRFHCINLTERGRVVEIF
jgi:glycyl-tRNA synthetase beta subunit